MTTAGRKYEVTAVLTAATSVQEFSKVFEGLTSLHRSGRIRFRIRPSTRPSVARVIRLEAQTPLGDKRTIGIDIADSPEILDADLLASGDVYFKRSLASRVAPPRRDGHNVQAFGLNNPAISPGTALRIIAARLRTGRGPGPLAVDARQLLALPRPSAFEHPPSEPAEPLVLFQTRVWEPNAIDSDAEEINEERTQLVRTLRSAFGPRFVGGVIPTTYARANYPDLITSLPFRMRAYPAVLERPLIAIYSRGLLDSLAFKMSEYQAASRCIVGHTPRSVLPQPLVSGRNYLPFETADQCVAGCEELLARPAAAAEMRQANWDYYRSQVEPSAHLLSVLNRAFAK